MKKFFLMLLAMMLAMTTLSAFAEDEAVIPSPEAEEMAEAALFGGFVTPVFITVFILGGLAMVFFGLKPNKRY